MLAIKNEGRNSTVTLASARYRPGHQRTPQVALFINLFTVHSLLMERWKLAS